MDTRVTRSTSKDGKQMDSNRRSEQATDLVFLGLITPHDPVTGEVVLSSAEIDPAARKARFGSPMIDIPVDRTLAQAWTAFENLRRMLEDRQLGLERVARLRVLIRDLRDLHIVERVAELVLGDVRPAISVVEIPGSGVDAAIQVALDAVAVAPPMPAPEPIGPAGERLLHAPTPSCVRTGDLVFIGATAGRLHGSGALPRRIEELEGDAPALADFDISGDQAEAALCQSWLLFQTMKGVLAAQGGSLSDIVKVNGWLTFPIRDYKAAADVRLANAIHEGLRPASAGVQIQRVFPESAELTFEAVALLSGTGKRQGGPTSTMSEMYSDAQLAGRYVWTAGDVPVDVETPRVITNVGDLEGEGRRLAVGMLHRPAAAEIQAWDVYARHRRHLARFGASLEDVVHQTVFIRRPEAYPELERAARANFGGTVPPTTIVPVRDVSPYEETDMEIELVAKLPDGDPAVAA
ncbi:MAG: hypothetical protein QOH00_486 [Gaiellales bacterium]|jgi:enamine deaminase RidA (YjgF/YER057c/UK114 family)|nr:hypothetical protein [Gaiellales bacterium]